MSVIELLASSLGQKGAQANIDLAKKISDKSDKKAVKELVENLKNKDKKIQSDCIKTLYELAYIKPEMISNYLENFLEHLNSKQNRMVWGAMIAISTIVDLRHKDIFNSLDKIMETVNKGSVITIDSGVIILANLNKYDEYFDKTDKLLSEQMLKCPIKQLPMYMERSLISITSKNAEIYSQIIINRLGETEKDSQKKRLEKILKKIEKL